MKFVRQWIALLMLGAFTLNKFCYSHEDDGYCDSVVGESKSPDKIFTAGSYRAEIRKQKKNEHGVCNGFYNAYLWM